jgi:hypothetical protein
MTFAGEPTQEQDQQHLNVDQVQATMKQDHENLQVEMRRSQAVSKDGANRGHIVAPNFQEGSKVWFDSRNIQTILPTRKLDWKRIGHCRVCRGVSLYVYEFELPASIRIQRVQPV